MTEVNGEMCKLVSSNLANIKGELRCNSTPYSTRKMSSIQDM